MEDFMITSKRTFLCDNVLYFYHNVISKYALYFLFDVNEFLWNRKSKLLSYLPAWKEIYLFTKEDYYKNINLINRIIRKRGMGKILECEVSGKTVIMIVLYHLSSEKKLIKSIEKRLLLNCDDYEHIELSYSLKVHKNVFISQGEGWHREVCSREELLDFFSGEKYYKYRRC